MVRSSSHTFTNTRGHLSNIHHDISERPLQPASTCMLRFMVSCSFFHVQPVLTYSVLSSSQSLLLYTTTCMECRWRDPCSMAMLGMYTHASTSDYLLFTRFFLPTSFQGYWNAASINDRLSLNTTAGKPDI